MLSPLRFAQGRLFACHPELLRLAQDRSKRSERAQNDRPPKVFQRPVNAFMERAWGFYSEVSQDFRIVWLAVLGPSIEAIPYSRKCLWGSPTRRKRS